METAPLNVAIPHTFRIPDSVMEVVISVWNAEILVV
jgi:hypothetical protein